MVLTSNRHMKQIPTRRVFLVVALFLSFSLPTVAELTSSAPATEPTVTEMTGLTVQAIQARIKGLELATQLDEAVRATAIEYCNLAVKELQSAEEWARKDADYHSAIQDAPAQLQAARDELKKIPESPAIPPGMADGTLEQLRQGLAKAEADLARSKQRLADLDREPRRRLDRRTEVKKRREEISKELASAAEPQGPATLTAAFGVCIQARAKARQAELAAYDSELASYDAAGDLLSVQRDLAVRQASQNERLVALWQEAIAQQRQEETARQVREAEESRRRADAESQPVARRIAALAEENKELVQRRQELGRKIGQAVRDYNSRKDLLDRTKRNAETVREKVQAAGVTKAMGQLLRKERTELPKINQLRRREESLHESIAEVELELLDLRKQRDLLVDIPSLVSRDMLQFDPAFVEGRKWFEDELTKLYENERDYLQSLISDGGTYHWRLIDLQDVTESLIKETEGYLAFINQHILWLRSHEEMNLSSLLEAWDAAKWLVREAEWGDALRSLVRDAREHPVQVAFSLLVVVLFVGNRRRFRRLLVDSGEKARQKLNTSITPTVIALACTLMLALSWPLVLWLISWRLSVPVSASETTKTIGMALGRVGAWLLVIGGIRELLRPKGLAEAHLGWSPGALKVVRRNLGWLLLVGMVITFVIAFVEQWQVVADWKDSVSRLAFLAVLVAFAVFIAQVLRPGSGIFAGQIARHRGGTADRYRAIWYWGLVAIPVVLAGFTIAGYYYTSLQLMAQIYRTAWFVLALLVIRGLILRWLFLTHRRLAIAQARKRLAEKQAEQARDGVQPPGEATVEEAEPELDIAALSQQTQHLFRAALWLALVIGLYLIWVDILPALKYLRSIVLYSPDPHMAITLADLALAVVTAIMTVSAGKNVPAFLEITILSHLPLKSGERYAVVTVVRYAILAVGIVVACGLVGVSWSSIHWLIAAMTVGLGFGLQEIFANFVSGLILLFERPIRIGDTVTVGDISGTISRIQIRATTITSWDRKELIIPNKEFVTGKVINWTLSDQSLRIVIPIGVAYGSDTARVEWILRQVAGANSEVLKDPAPQAFFVGFGASSLDFELRVFTLGVDRLISVKHALLNAIDKAFRDAGIEIAFPQQDVHIRSVKDVFPVVQKPGD